MRFWCSGCLCLGSWDDSSSVSSGISDTIDNLSTDDINTSSSISSYANTPASSRKNLDVQVRSTAPSSAPPLALAARRLGCVWAEKPVWRKQNPQVGEMRPSLWLPVCSFPQPWPPPIRKGPGSGAVGTGSESSPLPLVAWEITFTPLATCL